MRPHDRGQRSSIVGELRGKIALVAGIDQRNLIYREPLERIVTETRRLGSESPDLPGLILAPARELSFDTPLENILAFRDAVHAIR